MTKKHFVTTEHFSILGSYAAQGFLRNAEIGSDVAQGSALNEQRIAGQQLIVALFGCFELQAEYPSV